MRPLKTTSVITLRFTLVSLGLLFVVGITFSFVSYISAHNQIKSDLLTEATEIVREHLVFEQGHILYKENDTGENLAEHLDNDQISALIYNAKLERIGAFGAFERMALSAEGAVIPFSSSGKNVQIDDYAATLGQTLNRNQIQYATNYVADQQQFVMLTYPIRLNNETIGVIQLGKEANTIRQIFQTNSYIFLGLVPFALLLSALFGYYQSRAAFKPVHEMVRQIRRVQAENIDTQLNTSGHPQDDLVLLSREFNDMLKRLKNGIERQNQFVANASHELKTPLTKAISSLDVASLANSDPAYNLIKQDLFALSDLIDQMLFLARMSETSLKDKVQNINLVSVIKQSLKRSSAQLDERNITVTAALPEKLTVQGNNEHLRSLFDNLIDNAIKYNKERGTLTITALQTDQFVKLTLADSGVGIAPEDLPYIFDRFYRAKTTRQTRRGTGLGLAIVKQICDLYGYEIDVTSRQEEGTQFVLTFKNA